MSASLRPRSPSRLGPGALAWRAAFLAIVLALGFYGFASGVEVSERPDLPNLGYAAKLYYAMSLFVFGGVDIGTPQGPTSPGLIALWLAYICAPLVTAGAVIDTATRLLNPLARRLRRLQDHVVVAGAGRLSLLYIKRLREVDPHVSIVVVERDANRAQINELERTYRAVVLIGDISSDEVLDGVAVGHTRRVMLLTGEDFANLDAASRLLTRLPWLRGKIVAHVADLGFLRAVPDEALTSGYDTFNSLEFAATHLVEHRLLDRFSATAHRDLVIFAGFGRFGQTVLHQLQLRASEAFGPIILVDLHADANALAFAESPGFGDNPRHVIEGHLRHPAVWQRVDELVARYTGEPVIIVGTGDESTNLHTALDLRRRYPEAHITVRSFARSPFAKDVATRARLQPFELAELISSSMPAAWFEDPSS